MVYHSLHSYRQRVRVITRFPNIFFVLFLHIKRVCKSLLKNKADAYKQLIFIMQHVHFKSESVFSVVKTNIYFVILDIVVKTSRMWFSVICTLIDNDLRHHRKKMCQKDSVWHVTTSMR